MGEGMSKAKGFPCEEHLTARIPGSEYNDTPCYDCMRATCLSLNAPPFIRAVNISRPRNSHPQRHTYGRRSAGMSDDMQQYPSGDWGPAVVLPYAKRKSLRCECGQEFVLPRKERKRPFAGRAMDDYRTHWEIQHGLPMVLKAAVRDV